MTRLSPVTFALAAAIVLVGAVTGVVRLLGRPADAVSQRLGTGLIQVAEGHLYSLVSAVFITTGFVEFVLTVAGVALLVGAAERLMGPWRTLIAFFVSAVAGVALGVVLQWGATSLGEADLLGVQEESTSSAFAGIVGAIMAASSFAETLWRRRIRLVGFFVLAMFVLYSGTSASVYAMIGAIVGLVLGLGLRRRRPELSWQRSSHAEARSLTAALLAITALGPLLTLYTPRAYGPLRPLAALFQDVLPGLATITRNCHLDIDSHACLRNFALARLNGPGPILLTLLPLVAVLVAAIGVARGKRAAGVFAVVVNLLLSGLAAYYYGFLPFTRPDPTAHLRSLETTLTLAVSVLVPLAVAVIVIVNLRHLNTPVSGRALRKYGLGVVVTFVVTAATYMITGAASRDQFRPPISVSELFRNLPERYIPIGFLGVRRIVFVPTGVLPVAVSQWVGPVFWLVVIVGVALVLRSRPSGQTAGEEQRARSLVRRHGGGSLGYMATWTGNSWWFSEDNDSCVAYRMIGGVAITVSEPICAPQNRDRVVREFARFADDFGWTPVFYSVHDEYREIFRSMGWSKMAVAEEAVLRPETWSTRGSRWQDVRSAINRAKREQVRAEWTTYEQLSSPSTRQIEAISEQWVAEHSLPELDFTLGSLRELRDPEVHLMLAVSAEERVEAVTSWLPCYRNDAIVGWTLDFMRRRSDSMNGVMDFLIASMAARMKQSGEEFLSLSAAPLARTETGIEAAGRVSETDDGEGSEPEGSRLLAFLSHTLEPVYGFGSLLQFKLKFQPELRRLTMAYPDAARLPQVGTSLARAYLPSLSPKQTVALMRKLAG